MNMTRRERGNERETESVIGGVPPGYGESAWSGMGSGVLRPTRREYLDGPIRPIREVLTMRAAWELVGEAVVVAIAYVVMVGGTVLAMIV